MLKLAVVSLSLLVVSGFHCGAHAATACGCEAECPEGFTFHSVSDCHDKKHGNTCKSHTEDKKCEVVCSKAGEENKKVEGTCHEVRFKSH